MAKLLTLGRNNFTTLRMYSLCAKNVPHLLLGIGDQLTIDRIKQLIADLQAQKATLHPEQKQEAATWRPSYLAAFDWR